MGKQKSSQSEKKIKHGHSRKKKSFVYKLISFYIKLGAVSTIIPMILNIIVIACLMLLLMFAGAGIIQFFDTKDKTLEDMNINWDDFKCTCVHLTAEEIAKVKAGGQVEVGGSNGAGLNVSGGSVVTGAHGKKITDAQLNPYDLPLYDGLTMDASQLGCESWEVDFNMNSILQGLKSTYVVSQETRAHEGSSYQYVNYSPNAKSGTKTPYTEVDGRMSIAMTWRFNTKSGSESGRTFPSSSEWTAGNVAGKYCDIVFDDGTVLATIFGSSKGNESEASKYDYWAHYDGSVIEVVQYTDIGVKQGGSSEKYAYAVNMTSQNGLPANGNYGPAWKSVLGNKNISKVIVYDKAYYSNGQYTNWFTEVTGQLSSSTTNDTTVSFGQTGGGTTQSNTGNSGLSSSTSIDYDLTKFSVAGNANLIVVVEGTGGSNCSVKAFEKSGSNWEERVNTVGVLGKAGMSNNRTAGDNTTPIGVFKMNTPFGQADSEAGFPSDYVKVDEHDFWSAESATYNTFVRDTSRTVSGEALGTSGFSQIYDYVIDSGYNKSCVAGKGSALFLHCTKPGKTHTAGCVAIPKDDMKTIMKLFAKYENNSYIIQSNQGTISKLYDAYNNDGQSPSGDFTSSGSTGSGSSGNTGSTSSGSTGVSQNTLKYQNGEKISLDSSWEYANFSKINSGAATYYTSTSTSRKNICITVNAGHGTSGGDSVKTQSHPDGTGKYTSGTTGVGETLSTSISSGMTFKDGTYERTANLEVAKKLKDKLLSNGYDVLMIRESDDEQLDNIARTVISNNVSDAHIAIHFDSTETDKGAFYMKVVDRTEYKNMSPVKEHWQEHDALGESLLTGLQNANCKIWSSRTMDSDLTQTSYSVIPSIDIELGDKGTTLSDSLYESYAQGLALGVDEFFKTHTPINQGKRGMASLGGTEGGTSNNSNLQSGTINPNLDNLRTKCMIKEEGICGCYISDPTCMCHVLAGTDGVIGTEDDNKERNPGSENQNNVQTTQSDAFIAKALQVFNLMYGNGRFGGNPYDQDGYANINIDGMELRIRRDCSGYVSAVMRLMGATFNSSNLTTSGIHDIAIDGTIVASDMFIVLPYSAEALQPGDIMNINARDKGTSSGHTQIFTGWDSNGAMLGYNWGSDDGINGYPKDESGNVIGPKIMGGTYTYIIRYVGSGGAGK